MPRRRLLIYCVIIVIGVALLGLWRSSYPSSLLEPGFRSGNTKETGRKQQFKPTLHHLSMDLEPEQQRKAFTGEKQLSMAQDAIASGLAKERMDELVRVTRMMGEVV